ncbi:MAG: hypothetical protein OEM99_09215 [Gammaproteobacteria bacterium]|nr:hypothetical protein [Gammaproteobacteria bacterium]
MNRKSAKSLWPRRPGAGHGLFTIPAVALLLIGLGFASPAFVEAASTDQRDPLVNDVVRMLDAGIESDLIISWLQSGDSRPAPLSADELIALTAAKASRDLIELLLAMAPAPVAPMSSSQDHADAPAPIASPGVTQPSTRSAVALNDDCCLVEFSIRYQAAEDKEGEEVEQAGRDLFLYADGRLLTRIESQGNIASGAPVLFKTRMAPGEHTLRFTRDLHSPAKGAGDSKSWEHETTVSPSIIRFELEPDALWQLDFSWVQSEFSTKRPLRWSWSRNGVAVAGEAGVGEFRERWPFLCEDVEISRDEGAISEWRARDRLKSCVSWASLWPGSVDTTRAELLHSLRRFDFEPVAGSALRIE